MHADCAQPKVRTRCGRSATVGGLFAARRQPPSGAALASTRLIALVPLLGGCRPALNDPRLSSRRPPHFSLALNSCKLHLHAKIQCLMCKQTIVDFI